MRALLWKDFRLNRTVVFVSLAMLVVPYGFAAALAVNELLAESMPLKRSWVNLLLGANHFGLMFSFVVLALAGGNTFAAERADRSAEFLAYLPPSKAQVAVSKALVGAVIGSAFWAINLVILNIGSRFVTEEAFQYLDVSELTPKPYFAAVCLLSFGVSWLVSSFISSTGPAVTAGLAAPAVVFLGFQTSHAVFGFPTQEMASRLYFSSCVSLGLSAFAIGFWAYIGRAEP